MLDFEKWEEILYVLKNKYTILSTGFKENHYNLKYTTPVYDLKIREIAALMRACGKCIMVESGMFHLGVASGAFCFGIIPGYGYIAADANNGRYPQITYMKIRFGNTKQKSQIYS